MSNMDDDSNRTPSKAQIVKKAKKAKKVFSNLSRHLSTDMVSL
jgi:hypothetical protein